MNNLQLIVLFLSLAFLFRDGACKKEAKQKKVYAIKKGNGSANNAMANELPFQLFIKTGSSVCEGVIVNKQFALTSAHCTDDLTPEDIKVTAGEHRVSKTEGVEVHRSITKIIRHKGWNSTTRHNDIALLKFDKPLIYNDYVQSVKLAAQNSNNSGIAVATGWGREAKILQKLYLPIIKQEDCKKKYAEVNYDVYQTQICAGYLGVGKYTCIENFGGTLLTHNGKFYILVGISTLVPGCNGSKYPGVYTRISKYTKWILSNSKKT